MKRAVLETPVGGVACARLEKCSLVLESFADTSAIGPTFTHLQPGRPFPVVPPPWPPHPPGLARWCRPSSLGSRSSRDCVFSRRWLVLVLAACPIRIQWPRSLR